MSKWRVIPTTTSALVFVLASLVSISGLRAQTEPFYANKTIRIIAGAPPGGGIDTWSRLIARHIGRYVPGNPRFIVVNMPGAGTRAAANHIYNVEKPDGLAFGLVLPALYFDQLLGGEGVQFDWARYTWIGSPESSDEALMVRSDSPYQSAEDLLTASEPAQCGATGTSGSAYYFPRLVQSALGSKVHMVVGYRGTGDILMAMKRGEVNCRAGTISTLFGTEPLRTWIDTGFIRVLVQGSSKRDSRLAGVPTIYELMKKKKVPERTRRVADVVLAAGRFGRPIIAPPGIPVDRVKILRQAFTSLMDDSSFKEETNKLGWEINHVKGEELERLAKEVVSVPSDVIHGLKEVLLPKSK